MLAISQTAILSLHHLHLSLKVASPTPLPEIFTMGGPDLAPLYI
jgi:hypothetical protein